MDRTYAERLDLAVYGADQLTRLAARLKDAGDLTLRRRMMAALRASAREVADAEKAAALSLPAAKYDVGLRQEIAGAITTRTQTTANRAGVRVMVNRAQISRGAGHLPVLMNRGGWRHPVFGNRKAWTSQSSKRGWWTTVADRESGPAQDRMLEVLRETAREIAGD